MISRRTPKRREIWHMPAVRNATGTEIQGARFVVVLSDAVQLYGSETVCVAVITQGGQGPRNRNLTVSLQNIPHITTQGVVLCHAVRYVDLNAAGASFKETVPAYLIDEILKKIVLLFHIDSSHIP